MIEYRKGDLFDAPKGAVLAHACNAQGVWGSGIALAFKQKFPDAYLLYRDLCLIDFDSKIVDSTKKKETRKSVGHCFLVQEQEYRIACLITSDRYGPEVDNPTQILQATRSSLEELLTHLNDGDEIHMPKINSLRFKTPWDETEKCIESILSISDKKIKCVVWVQE